MINKTAYFTILVLSTFQFSTNSRTFSYIFIAMRVWRNTTIYVSLTISYHYTLSFLYSFPFVVLLMTSICVWMRNKVLLTYIHFPYMLILLLVHTSNDQTLHFVMATVFIVITKPMNAMSSFKVTIECWIVKITFIVICAPFIIPN